MKIVLSHRDIQNRVQELAYAINEDFQNEEITLVCVLKGAAIFFTDLSRYLTSPVRFEFFSVSSYGDDETPQTLDVGMIGIRTENFFEKHVIIVEDIIETGGTIQSVLELIRPCEPKSLSLCVLTDKAESDGVFKNLGLDRCYLGFKVTPGAFLVGYGMDNKQLMRNHKDITIKRDNSKHISLEKLNGSRLPNKKKESV